ncbi:hypothetical protein N665_0136s0004 [Sinapis alba]|nr:hypothetical protein N665_0136s0004 [Sinapis alba]
MNTISWNYFQVSFGYNKLFTVEPDGRSGGLALFYMDSYDVSILYFDKHMIDISATIEGHKVYLTFVYGDPFIETGVWFMYGDFNEITGNHEKIRGKKRSETYFIAFKAMLAACGMVDFPYKGNSMSWVGYCKSGKVQRRLDRAVGNEDWHQYFFHTNVEYLKLWGSDHRPDGLRDALEEGWGPIEPDGNRPLHVKLRDDRRAISRWKRANLSNSEKKIATIKELLRKHNMMQT